eukprot:201121_1
MIQFLDLLLFLSTVSQGTIINGTWLDDYDNAQWSFVTSFNNVTTDTIVVGNVDATYHGPYEGKNVYNDMEIRTLERKFYCSSSSLVLVTFTLYFCDTESQDYLILNFGGRSYKNRMSSTFIPLNSTETFYNDTTLTGYSSGCRWHFWDLGPYNFSLIDASKSFSVNFSGYINYPQEWYAISNIEITCNGINVTSTIATTGHISTIATTDHTSIIDAATTEQTDSGFMAKITIPFCTILVLYMSCLL